MHRPGRSSVTRRNLLTSVAGGAAAGSLFKLAESTASAQANPAQPVNRFSAPSNLKITDIRAATVATYYDYPLIRIDTNQGVYGLGEVFAAGTKGSALMLKPFLVGRNPVEIEAILRPLRGSVGQSFWNSGYGAIDLALHDIAGKVYGVPAWRLLGEKLQNRVLLYADTAGAKDPKQYAQRVDRRRKMGFRFFKMDLETPLVADRQGAVFPNGIATDKGLGYLCEYLAAARDVLGKGVPIAGDHFVQPEERMSVKDAIRYARAFEPYGLAWAEDLIGRNSVRWREFKEIRQNTTTPILTGEMAFGVEGFRELIENQAVDIIHPDYVFSGGMLEIKRIADYAAAHSIKTAIHLPGSPIGMIAMAHVAATLTTTNFVAIEMHAADMPWWQDLVKGVEKPIVNDGYVRVPDSPGLGLELNDDVVKEHLREPGFFAPTPEYDKIITSGFRTSGPWPHFKADGTWCNCTDE